MFDECAPSCLPSCQPRKVRVNAPMATASVVGNVPVEATQRDYATARIKDTITKLDAILQKQFNIGEQRPRTAVDLIAAIKDGEYTLDTKVLTEYAEGIKSGYYNNEFGIKWGKPADTEGFTLARKALKDAAQAALDVATLGPVDGLQKAITDFEAWVYTPAA